MFLVTAAEQRAADASFSKTTGLPTILLMEQAAVALAEAVYNIVRKTDSSTEGDCDCKIGLSRPGVRARTREIKNIAILCGCGNNGGDGYALARHLVTDSCHLPADLRRHIKVYEYLPQRKRLGDAALNRSGYLLCGGEIAPLAELTADATTLYVDAVWGTGYKAGRPVDAEFRAAAITVNSAKQGGATVLAVDIPSGLEADTGKASEIAILADSTITFGYGKPGLYINQGRHHCGHVKVAPLTIPLDAAKNSVGEQNPPTSTASATLSASVSAKGSGFASPDGKQPFCRRILPELDDFVRLLQPRQRDSYKGTNGNAAIIAGDPGMSGAAALAAAGAWQSGPGKVFAWVGRSAETAILSYNPAVLASERPSELTDAELRSRVTDYLTNLGDPAKVACLVGPGLNINSALETIIEAVLAWPGQTVFDASALTALSLKPVYWLELIQKRQAAGLSKPLFTPHLGEYKCLLKATAALPEKAEMLKSENDLSLEAEALAEIWQANILVKGTYSFLTGFDDKIVYLPYGNYALAHAGSGDLLSGTIVGLAAQGHRLPVAAALGAFLCGRAAEIYIANGGSPRCFFWQEQLRLMRQIMAELESGTMT